MLFSQAELFLLSGRALASWLTELDLGSADPAQPIHFHQNTRSLHSLIEDGAV